MRPDALNGELPPDDGSEPSLRRVVASLERSIGRPAGEPGPALCAHACGDLLAAAYTEDVAELGLPWRAAAHQEAFVVGAVIGLEQLLRHISGADTPSESTRILRRLIERESADRARSLSGRVLKILEAMALERAGYCDGYRPDSPARQLSRLYQELLLGPEPAPRTVPGLLARGLDAPLDALCYARHLTHGARRGGEGTS